MRGGAEPTARGRGGPSGDPDPRPEPRESDVAPPWHGASRWCTTPGGAPPDGSGVGRAWPGGGPARRPHGGAPTRAGTGWAGQAGRRLGGVRLGRGPDSGPDTRPARYRGRWCGAAGRGMRSRTCPGACQRPRRGSTPDRGRRTPPSPAPTSTPHTAYDLRFPPPVDPSTDPPRRPKSVAGFHGPAMRPPRVRRDPPPLSARGARARGRARRPPAARRGPARAPTAQSTRAGTPRRRSGAATPHGPPRRSGRIPEPPRPGRAFRIPPGPAVRPRHVPHRAAGLDRHDRHDPQETARTPLAPAGDPA